jgi:DNA polymerase-1
VRTVTEARIAVAALYKANAVHCCDTEVADIDLKNVGPVGHGKVTCVSIFSGRDVDYGDGPGKALWIDNLDSSQGLINEFKAWFEDESQKKVWHNYGFDRHVLFNEGINALGFAGDTMHMARLADSSRDKSTGPGAGYSLEALTQDYIGRRKVSSMNCHNMFCPAVHYA